MVYRGLLPSTKQCRGRARDQPSACSARRNGSGAARRQQQAKGREKYAHAVDPGRPANVGQTKTRSAEGEPGCMRGSVWFFALNHFAGDSGPASTVLTVRAEVHFALRVIAINLLTRFRRKRLLSET